MKQYLRNRISRMASYFEIVLSIFILFAVFLVAFEAVVSLASTVDEFFHGQYQFRIHGFMVTIFELIIAVEFVKMVAKHTPESTIEVLLFVIARKIVIDEPAYDEILLGVLAIAALFMVKKYLTRHTHQDSCILEGSSTIREVNRILNTHVSASAGQNLANALQTVLDLEGKPLFVGQEVDLQGITFRIYSIKDQQIDAVEAEPQNIRRLFRRLFKKDR